MPEGKDRPRRLMKLAYTGAPSRAYFPLTEEFAKSSNNSTVAMTGNTGIIQDVTKLADDVPSISVTRQY
jgi:hypothetical protein